MAFPSDVLTSLTNPGDTDGSAQHVSELNRVFSGEVYAEFGDKNVFLPLTRNKTVPMGARSCQFKFTSRLVAVDYTPGNNIFRDSGDADIMHVGSRTVALDKPVLAASLVTDYESFLNDFDEQSQLAMEVGRALALKMDNRIAQAICYAALNGTKAYTSSNGAANDEPLGHTIYADPTTGTAVVPSALDMIDAMRRARVALDEAEVPEDERFMVISPSMYQQLAGLIVTDGTVDSAVVPHAVHKDYTNRNGGLDVGEVMSIHGFRLQWSNRISDIMRDASGDSASWQFDSNVTDSVNDYRSDLSRLYGIFGHKDAVATALGRGIGIETYWDPDYQSWKIIGKYYAGHAPLRPVAAGVILSNSA